MAGKIFCLICDILVLAGLLLRFGNVWSAGQPSPDPVGLLPQIILIMAAAFALTKTLTNLVRTVRQKRREREENRIGPDL